MATIPVTNFKTTLTSGLADGGSDTTIDLASVTTTDGHTLAMSDIGDIGFIVINPRGSSIEICSFTGITSLQLTGVTRGLAFYGISYARVAANCKAHSSGETVILSDNHHLFSKIKDYVDSVAVSGASDANTTTKGIVEEATAGEIEAGSATGATSARLYVNPNTLLASSYGTQLPSSSQKVFLGGTTGMITAYGGAAAPTGFLLCDGTSYDADTYPSLAAVIASRYGIGTTATFTANVNNTITSATHGLSNGNIIFVESTGTLPAGLSQYTPYYIISAATNTFEVSATSGGSAVDITDTGSGTHSWSNNFKVPNLVGSVPLGKGQLVKTMSFLDAAVNTGTDTITVTSNDWLHTGQKVALTNSGGTLPGGLAAQNYYVIRSSATTIKLASTLTLANTGSGTAVDITSAAGGGTHTMTLTMTSRAVGDSGGVENQGGVATHKHTSDAEYEAGGSGSGGTGGGVDTAVTIADSGQEFPTNMMPYVAVCYIIKT